VGEKSGDRIRGGVHETYDGVTRRMNQDEDHNGEEERGNDGEEEGGQRGSNRRGG
jgi:hypothetical protein